MLLNAGRTLAVLVAAAGLALAPTGAAAIASSDPGPLQGPACPEGYLCVFEGANFTEPRVDLVACSAEPVDLRPTFGRSMGSFVNNQTGDQVAEFFKVDDAGHPVPAFSSTAVDARSDTSGVGVYFVKPC